jgi:hypothetical protein
MKIIIVSYFVLLIFSGCSKTVYTTPNEHQEFVPPTVLDYSEQVDDPNVIREYVHSAAIHIAETINQVDSTIDQTSGSSSPQTRYQKLIKQYLKEGAR